MKLAVRVVGGLVVVVILLLAGRTLGGRVATSGHPGPATAAPVVPQHGPAVPPAWSGVASAPSTPRSFAVRTEPPGDSGSPAGGADVVPAAAGRVRGPSRPGAPTRPGRSGGARSQDPVARPTRGRASGPALNHPERTKR